MTPPYNLYYIPPVILNILKIIIVFKNFLYGVIFEKI